MADEIPTICSICGLEVVAQFVVSMPPIEYGTVAAACPFHVDAVLARIQENLHETMTTYDGVLRDWWDALYPPPEEEP